MLAILTSRPGRIAAQAVVLTAVVGGSVTYAAIDKAVALTVDGEQTQVRSMSGTVAGLLDSQHIKVSDRDLVAPGLKADLHDGDTIVVRYARPLNVSVDGGQRTYWTTELTVDKALSALGIRAEGARMSASRSQPIGRTGLALSVTTPKKVVVAADGRTQALTTTAPTVASLLSEQKLTVGSLDKLSVAASAPVVNGLVVKLTRIVRKNVSAAEAIAFATTSTKTDDLAKGDVDVVTKGRKGQRTAVYAIVTADGKVIDKDLVSARIVTAPVTQVQKVGTKVESSPSSSSGGGSVSGSGGSASGLNWAALAKCESGGRVDAYNSAGYYGLYQFSMSTWRAMGGSGSPADASASEQTARAQKLYNQSGRGQWPNCGRYL